MNRKYHNSASRALTWLIIFFSLVAITVSLVLAFVIGKVETFVLIFFISLFILEGVALFVPFLIMSSSRQTRRGTKKYLDNIQKYSSLPQTHLIKNISLDKDHKIDYLLISTSSVYAINGVSYQGVINGMDSDDNWTQALRSQNTRNAFPNPIKKQLESIELLKAKYKLDIDIVPVVVMLSSNRGYIISKYLYSPIQFVSLLENNKVAKFKPNEVESIYVKLDK